MFFVKLLADFYQLFLQAPDFVPGLVVAVDTGAMIIAQGGPQVIGAGGIEFGAVERCHHVVHLLIQGNVGEQAADFLLADLGGIAERLGRMHLFGQAGAIFGVRGNE